MTSGQTSVLCVLLNYRTPDMCARAAEAAVVALGGLDAELVIVDNDSGDGSYEQLSAFVDSQNWPHVRVLASGRNGGFGAGNNIGIRAGRSDGRPADYIYVLNSDAFPEPDAIRVLANWLDKNPKTGITGSFIQGEDGGPHLTAFRFPSIAGEIEQAARSGPISRLFSRSRVWIDLPTRPARVDWMAGASLLLRREMLDEIGLFDETYFLYFEETDLCLRASRAGWEAMYLPDSRVTHVGSVSTGMRKWERIPRYWLDSRLHYFTKSHGASYAALATGAHVLGGLVWRLRRLIQRKPAIDPPHFLRDMIAHHLRTMFASRPAKPIAEPAKRLP